MKKVILASLLTFVFVMPSLLAQQAEPIRVGVILDMSGATAGFGIETNNGINMAVSEINSRGGIKGRKIEIFLEDTKGSLENAEKVTQALVSISKVHVIVGEVTSTISLVAAYALKEVQIPLLTPAATNPKVTEVGNYIFRSCFVDPLQGEAMARFAFNELRLRRAAIFVDANSDYSQGLAKTFAETFQRLGGKMLPTRSYSQMDQSYDKQLKKIRRSKPDVIYIPGYYGEASIIASEARKLGMNMPLLGGDGWDLAEIWKLGGDSLRNTYITNHFANDDPAIEVQNFVKKYQAKYNSSPNTLAALGYDAVYLLADAVSRANSTDGAKLRDALATTKDFQGVTGKITIDKAHNAIKPVIILKLDEKKEKFTYRSTIQPDSPPQ